MTDKMSEAIKIVGGQKNLARLCGVSQTAVHKWFVGKTPISADRAIAIELATKGQVSRKDLRPDLPW